MALASKNLEERTLLPPQGYNVKQKQHLKQLTVGNRTHIRKGNGSIPYHCKFRKCVQIPVLKNYLVLLIKYVLSVSETKN